MARMPRKESGTGIYHVMRRAKRDALFQLFAYCLMGNHVHLLLKEGE